MGRGPVPTVSGHLALCSGSEIRDIGVVKNGPDSDDVRLVAAAKGEKS